MQKYAICVQGVRTLRQALNKSSPVAPLRFTDKFHCKPSVARRCLSQSVGSGDKEETIGKKVLDKLEQAEESASAGVQNLQSSGKHMYDEAVQGGKKAFRRVSESTDQKVQHMKDYRPSVVEDMKEQFQRGEDRVSNAASNGARTLEEEAVDVDEKAKRAADGASSTLEKGKNIAKMKKGDLEDEVQQVSNKAGQYKEFYKDDAKHQANIVKEDLRNMTKEGASRVKSAVENVSGSAGGDESMADGAYERADGAVDRAKSKADEAVEYIQDIGRKASSAVRSTVDSAFGRAEDTAQSGRDAVKSAAEDAKDKLSSSQQSRK